MTDHKTDYVEINYICCTSIQTKSTLVKDITSTYECNCGKITKIVAFDNSSLYKELIDADDYTLQDCTFNESDNTLRCIKRIPSIDGVYKLNNELWILLRVLPYQKPSNPSNSSKNSDIVYFRVILVFFSLLLLIVLSWRCLFLFGLYEVHTLPYCVYRHLGDDQGELHPATFGDCQFQSEFIADFLPVCSISKLDADGKRVISYANAYLGCKFHEKDSIFIKRDMEKLTYRIKSDQSKNIPYCVYNDFYGDTYSASFGDCQFEDEYISPFRPVCSVVKIYEDGERSITFANRQDCKFHEEDSKILNRYKH